MRSRHWITVGLCLVFFCLLVVKSEAHMVNDVQRVFVFQRVAAQIFTPTCGQPVVTIQQPSAPDRDGESYIDGSCQITIRPGLSDARMCQVIVHEYGHLSGLEHAPADARDNIMNPYADADVPRCDAAIDAAENELDRAAVLLPTPPVLLKAIRRGTAAYDRGVRWVAYEQNGDRWLLSGSGNSMEAEYTGEYQLPKGSASSHA